MICTLVICRGGAVWNVSVFRLLPRILVWPITLNPSLMIFLALQRWGKSQLWGLLLLHLCDSLWCWERRHCVTMLWPLSRARGLQVFIWLATGVYHCIDHFSFECFFVGCALDSELAYFVYREAAKIDWTSLDHVDGQIPYGFARGGFYTLAEVVVWAQNRNGGGKLDRGMVFWIEIYPWRFAPLIFAVWQALFRTSVRFNWRFGVCWHTSYLATRDWYTLH